MEEQINEKEVKKLFTDKSDNDPSGDEYVVPPSVEEVEEKPAESSPEEKPNEEKVEETKVEPTEVSVEEPIKESEPVGPKPVEGETLKERALRFEVEKLRKANREKKKSEFFKEEAAEIKTETPTEEDIDLSQYNQEEIENFRKLFKVVAKKEGISFKGDTINDAQSQVLNDFLENHPEYDPKNDPDNLLWDKFREEFSVYKRPTDPRDFKKILEKVHREVMGSSAIDPATVAAQQTKLKTAAHGGTTTAKVTKQNSIDPALRPYLKGFDDSDFE